MGEKYSHVTKHDRLKIEALYQAGHSIREIAVQLGYSYPTIWREINVRGKYTHRNSDWTESDAYSADLAQQRYEEGKMTHGKGLKIGNDMQFVRYVEKKVLEEKKSPQAILYDIEKEGIEFDTKICLSTLYNYIRGNLFLNVTMDDLPMPRGKEPKKKAPKRQKRASAGTSIEKRPEEINNRDSLGHWEMDTVVGPRGKSKKCFLVLTERISLKEYIEILKDHSAKEVCHALDRLEREMGERTFRETFKSITVDNGTEFSDCEGIEQSRRNKRCRTKLYYCHAYSSYERAVNENQNRFVRRFYPKGMNFDHVTRKETKEMEKWMNNYPRKKFGGKSAEEMYVALQEQERRDAVA